MSHCPSCGRYVGPYEACPYCAARLAGRVPVRLVKIGAVVLSTVGLILLWLAATRAEVPLIQIGQAGATMNMAYVRLQGRCTREPSYDPESDYLSFWLEDDTGEIRVSSYRAETRQLIDEGRVPALGDAVEVAGTLRVQEDFYALTVNTPDQLQITRADPVDADIGAIGPSDLYRRVRVRGEVHSVYQPYEGLTLVTVRDATGEIPVAVSEDLVALGGPLPALTSGQAVEVAAAVSLYGDTPQLVPASVADVAPAPGEAAPVAAEKPVGELTAEDVGQLVVVRGSVAEVVPFSSGVKLTLDDGSGTAILLLWQDVYDALPDQAALGVGAELEVRGEVSEYEGALEVIPSAAEDVWVLAAAPALPQATIGALTAADVGRVVTLRGTLGEREAFSSGVRFRLDDGTGDITLLLWQNVYDETPGTGVLAAGVQVEVTGQIEAYRGELEIIPEAGGVTIVRGD
jgi:DNA/RNA endonuclease YhcR with UshA esterase domain